MASEWVGAWQDGLRPARAQTVSEWAAAHRVLGRAESAIPGRWDNDRAPFLRGIMDALSPQDPAEVVVVMAGSQLGKTEIGLNWLGFAVDVDPAPILAVQPTVELAKRWSRQRLSKLLAVPRLAGRVSEPASRSGSNTMFLKEFAGGVMVIGGGNSAAGLRSMPVRYLFLDEVDAYPVDVDGEGDPVELAFARTQTFAARKILLTSTPTVAGLSRIEAAYEETDRRRYLVPCPHCGLAQALAWTRPDGSRGVVWEHGRPETAAVCCEGCGSLWTEQERRAAVAAGSWVAQCEPQRARHVGFHLPGLCSPWATLGEIAAEFAACHQDPVRLKTFVNLRLGETWDDERGEKISAEALRDRPDPWDGKTVPDLASVLTAGADVQDDRLEVEVVAWGPGEESWSVDYVIIPGDPSTDQPWDDLDALLAREWPSRMGARKISAACIDTGGHHTQRAYAYCAARQRSRLWAIKGKGGAGFPIWPRRPTKANKARCPLYIVGVDAAKAAVVSRLRMGEVGPGYTHVPPDRSQTWFDQVTAEKQITSHFRGRPKVEWRLKRSGARNEALDCRVYAYAALKGWESLGRRLPKPVDSSPKPVDKSAETCSHPSKPPPPASPPRTRPAGGRRPGWFGRRR